MHLEIVEKLEHRADDRRLYGNKIERRTFLEHPCHFGKPRVERNVLEHAAAQHKVEGGVGKGHRQHVRLYRPSAFRESAFLTKFVTRDLQRLPRKVQCGDVLRTVTSVLKAERDNARAAASVKHDRSR